MQSIMIALIALSDGSAEVKATAICELISGKRLLIEQEVGIRAKGIGLRSYSTSAASMGRPSVDEYIRNAKLRKDQLHMIVSIIVNLALTLLPLFANDVNEKHAPEMARCITDFHQKRDICVKKLVKQFKSDNTKVAGKVSRSQ